MPSAINRLDKKLDKAKRPKVDVPEDMSFFEWLNRYGKVKVGKRFVDYTTKGRAPLFVVILILDYVLGNDVSYADEATRRRVLGSTDYGEIVPDAVVNIGGGAQFGKTILMLLFKLYCGTVKWFSFIYALPDDELVDEVVDRKERPEVLDQIPYAANLLRMGKSLTPTGKAENTKGGTLYTDGTRQSSSMMRGLTKIPTTFSADITATDERDDCNEYNAEFLEGRMTTSELRLSVSIGTMRIDGAGQNALYLTGSQHVGTIACSKCGKTHNPEESWPDICRKQMHADGPATDDPQLATDYTFKRHGKTVSGFSKSDRYYFACIACGTPLDRDAITYNARQPDRIQHAQWSVRVSQMCCSALSAKMLAASYCAIPRSRNPRAKRDAFNCDRLAMPASAGQEISKLVLDRAESVDPYAMTMQGYETTGPAARYGGIDVGDLCHIVMRERDAVCKRLLWAEAVPDSDLLARAVRVFRELSLVCMFIDAGPLRDKSRELALRINEMRTRSALELPPNWIKTRIRWASGIEWDGTGEVGQWRNLKCAPVEFTGKPGSGIKHLARVTPDGRYVYPVIACNRDEAIQAAVDELLTEEDGLSVLDETGAVRVEPVYHLPMRGEDQPAVLEDYRRQLLTGSRKIKSDDNKSESFIDKVENHYLLATVYAKLAETVTGVSASQPFAFQSMSTLDRAATREASMYRRSRKGLLL